MKPKLFIAIPVLLSSVLLACTEHDDVTTVQQLQQSEKILVKMTPQERAIKNYISELPAKTRATSPIPVPFIVDGDTLMYVVNYDNGWTLFSNDLRAPMVLMKSPTGSFYPINANPDVPFADVFKNSIDYLSALLHSDKEGINSSWGFYLSGGNDDGGNGGGDDGGNGGGGDSGDDDDNIWGIKPEGPGNGNPEDPDPSGESGGSVGQGQDPIPENPTPKGPKILVCEQYYSVFEYEYGEDTRIITEWDCLSPFNQFTPFYTESGKKLNYGLSNGAVALGQYLFWSHFNNELPASTITDAVYNANTNSYSYSGRSYDVWNSMVTSENYSDPSDSQAYRTTAMFLGYIDKQIGTYYGYNYSPDMNTYINVLKNQTGKNYTLEDVAEEKIESILSKYQPILCTSVRYVLNPTSGSTESQYPAQFIIDYGRKYTHYNIKYKVYESDFQAAAPKQWDSNTTYEELIEHYGAHNVFREETISPELFLKINWGMGGLYNDVEINAHAASWDLEGESETLKHNAVKLIYPVK